MRDQLDSHAAGRRLVAPPDPRLLHRLLDDVVEVDGTERLGGSRAAELLDARQGVDPGSRRRLDLLESALELPGLLPARTLEQELGAPQDAREDIVEDVTDTAGHVEEGLHLLVDGDAAAQTGHLLLRRLEVLDATAQA